MCGDLGSSKEKRDPFIYRFIVSSVCSYHSYLLSAYYVPGTVLDSEADMSVVIKTEVPPQAACTLVRRTQKNKVKKRC